VPIVWTVVSAGGVVLGFVVAVWHRTEAWSDRCPVTVGGVRPFLSRPGRLLLLVPGAAAIAALLGADPAVAAYLLDADLLVLLGGVGVALLAADVRVLARRARTATAVVLVRTGAVMTRERPRTLLP
jgi:hypothetical protein